MKKIIISALAILFSFSLLSCNNDKEDEVMDDSLDDSNLEGSVENIWDDEYIDIQNSVNINTIKTSKL